MTCGSRQAPRGNMTTETGLNLTRHDRRKLRLSSLLLQPHLHRQWSVITESGSLSHTSWSGLTVFCLPVNCCFLSHSIITAYYTLTLATMEFFYTVQEKCTKWDTKEKHFARSLVRRQCSATDLSIQGCCMLQRLPCLGSAGKTDTHTGDIMLWLWMDRGQALIRVHRLWRRQLRRIHVPYLHLQSHTLMVRE